jgi:hypothetical protein
MYGHAGTKLSPACAVRQSAGEFFLVKKKSEKIPPAKTNPDENFSIL